MAAAKSGKARPAKRLHKSSKAMEGTMLAALDAGIAEANRRERGEFDGLLGNVPEDAAALLSIVVQEARDCLLSHYTEGDARALLEQCDLQKRFAGLTEAEKDAVVREVVALELPDDVTLSLRLLNAIRRAYRSVDIERMVLGVSGARDRKRQAGTRQERRPDISRWIDKELQRNPGVKSPELWARAPDWITDQIGERRFATRVTDRRRVHASK